MINPIQKVLTQRSMTQRSLGIICVVWFPVISNLVSGEMNTLPKKVLKGLEELGENIEEIEKNYAVYKTEAKAAIMRSVKA